MRSRLLSRITIGLTLVLALAGGCQRAPLSPLDQAQAAHRSGNWNRAITICSEMLQQDPDNLVVLQLRGRAYLAMQDFDHAIKDFSHLIQLTPADHEIYYYRSMAYEGIGDQQHAGEDRAKGRELDPQRKSAYAFSPSNFVPQSTPIQPPPPSPESSEDKAAPVNELGAAVTADGKDASVPMMPVRPVRKQDAEHNEEYVRDAVDDFRRMISETEPKVDSSKSRTAGQDGPAGKFPAGLEPVNPLGPAKPSAKDTAKDEPEKPKSETPPANRPALSTALPPGMAPMGSLPGGPSPYVTVLPRAIPPATTPTPGVPQSGPAPVTTQFQYLPYGIPSLSGTQGQTVIQPNTIHPPGSKPVLSTSLPAGTIQAVPGYGSPPPAAAPYSGLPPMLPQPVRRYDIDGP